MNDPEEINFNQRHQVIAQTLKKIKNKTWQLTKRECSPSPVSVCLIPLDTGQCPFCDQPSESIIKLLASD